MDRWSVAKLVPAEWWERRGVRLGVVIAVWGVLYGALAVCYHSVLDHSWTDSLVFTVVVFVVNGVIQWWRLRGPRPRSRRPG